MPAYDFTCRDCESTFEIRRAISSFGDPVQCPKCQSWECAQGIVTPEFFTKGGWKNASSPRPAAATAHPAGCSCPAHRPAKSKPEAE